jgi:DNA-binding GntR family transcriptional regulator
MSAVTPETKVIQSISRKSLKGEIVEVLQKAIISGHYKPGDWLVERQLAAEFAVSTIPVREALQELESRGLVKRRPNAGCFVIELSPEEIRQISKLREVLEPKLIEWAAERITKEDGEKLQAQLDLLAKAAKAGDLPHFFYEDSRFHSMVWQISGNQYAVRALESAIGPLFAMGLMKGAHPNLPNLVKEVKKHQDFLNALRAGKVADALRIMAEIARGFDAHLTQ